MAIKGYWRLNGNSNDASGNGFNGTDANITYSQSYGCINQGASFNGINSKITTSVSGVSENADKTWMAWVRINVDLSGVDKYSVVTAWNINKTNNTFDYFRVGGVNSFYCDRGRVNTANDVLQYANVTASHGWYYLVGTISNSGATMCFYVDGVLIGTKTVNTGDGSGSAGLNFMMGVNSPVGTSFSNVSLDEVKLYNTTWSPAQVKNEYSRIKGFF